jgi:hypothetical protein
LISGIRFLVTQHASGRGEVVLKDDIRLYKRKNPKPITTQNKTFDPSAPVFYPNGIIESSIEDIKGWRYGHNTYKEVLNVLNVPNTVNNYEAHWNGVNYTVHISDKETDKVSMTIHKTP